MADRDRSQRHWNTVDFDGSIAADEVTEMVEHSDELVVGDLTHA